MQVIWPVIQSADHTQGAFVFRRWRCGAPIGSHQRTIGRSRSRRRSRSIANFASVPARSESTMNPIPLTAQTEAIARKLVWFESPADALANPIRFMAYALARA